MGVRNIRASILPGESTKIVSKGNGGNQICSYISLEKLKQIIACSRKPNAKVIAKDLGMEIINTHCVAIESTYAADLSRQEYITSTIGCKFIRFTPGSDIMYLANTINAIRKLIDPI